MWSEKGITYLGITLTNSISTLVKTNLNILITKLEKQLRDMANKEISWLGRIAAYKMLILPQILYIFRTIPLHIPQFYLNHLSRLGWKYIWEGKKARCPRNNLISHRKVGGAGLVDIDDYLWAVRLDHIKYWFRTHENPLWVDIEKTIAPTNDLTLLLLGDIWSPWDLSSISPTMQTSLKAWRFILRITATVAGEINYRIPLHILEAKIPMLSVKELVRCGITHVSDLYDGTQPMYTEQIMAQYQLPSNKLFSCLRISHFLKSLPRPQLKISPKIWQFYATDRQDTKGISQFYNLLHDKQTFKKTIAMSKWEHDLGTSLSNEQWQCAFKEIHKASHCVKHWELTIKITNRWYYTPYRLASFLLESSPQCWRDCGQIGNLLHMLWQCPNVRSLWNQTFQLISSLTGILTSATPALAILHLGIDRFPPVYRPVVSHVLLETRLLILRNWKSKNATNLSDVTKAVHRNYTFERLIAINSMQCNLFDKCWSIWPTQ